MKHASGPQLALPRASQVQQTSSTKAGRAADRTRLAHSARPCPSPAAAGPGRRRPTRQTKLHSPRAVVLAGRSRSPTARRPRASTRSRPPALHWLLVPRRPERSTTRRRHTCSGSTYPTSTRERRQIESGGSVLARCPSHGATRAIDRSTGRSRRVPSRARPTHPGRGTGRHSGCPIRPTWRAIPRTVAPRRQVGREEENDWDGRIHPRRRAMIDLPCWVSC